MNEVHVIVPDGLDRPTGGNNYDRRICTELTALGWTVHQQRVPGAWPWPDVTARARLACVIAAIADGAVVVVDGLIASTAPDVLVPETGRLRLVVLVHMPLGDASSIALATGARRRECEVLSAAAAVITTSAWTRDRLLCRYGLPPGSVHVARPGAERAALAPVTPDGRRLLCVAAVTPVKGHDLLLAALSAITDLAWDCTIVGSLDRDRDFVDRVRAQAVPLGDRVHFTGVRTGAALDASFAAADVLVLASRAETYGMVVTEALARGVPAIAADVGGVHEALGRLADGSRPGLLVPPRTSLAPALRSWLTDADLRHRLRHAARERRRTLHGWPATARRIADVLADADRPTPG